MGVDEIYLCMAEELDEARLAAEEAMEEYESLISDIQQVNNG